MASVKERIAALESYVKGLRPDMITFLLEDGTEFNTPLGAFEYLYEHGAVTPTGKRIAFYPHPVEGVDELSFLLLMGISMRPILHIPARNTPRKIKRKEWHLPSNF